MKNKIKFLIFVSIISYSVSCISIKPIYNDEEIKTAEAAVKKFHQLLNEEKYEELYNMTDEQARATKSKDAFFQLMKNVHSQLGNVSSSEKINSTAKSQAASTVVEMIYQTKFENGEIKEKFVWIVSDDKAGLFSFELVK